MSDFITFSGSNVEPFKSLNEMEINRRKDHKRIITKPMPRVEGPVSITGPLGVTEDWYMKKKRKFEHERNMEFREVKVEMIQLLAKKDQLRWKIGQLDLSSNKDTKKLASYNIKIRDIDADLKAMQDEYGVNVTKLDRGTRLSRFVGRVKRKVKKVVKNVKHWYNVNKEAILDCACVVLPVIGGLVVKKIQNWLGLFSTSKGLA